MRTPRKWGVVVLAAAASACMLALPAPAAAIEGGGVLGWVEDGSGAPVSGAVVSLFGKGLRGGGLVTFSDSTGRFFLGSLPAGSYTLRALGGRGAQAIARRVTVLPDRDAIFTLNLDTPDLSAAVEPVSAEARELRWLLRHKRRSVLEARAGGPVEPKAESAAASQAGQGDLLPELDASFEVVANPRSVADEGFGERVPTGLGVVRLRGRLAESGQWSLGGLLTESETTSWRMSAEFRLEPAPGHSLEAGAGYGTSLLQAPVSFDSDGARDNRRVGAIFVQERWRLGERFSAALGGRYSYIGFLERSHHLDPAAVLEFRPARHTSLRGSFQTRTLAPGGDLLTLSTLASAPAMAVAMVSGNLQAERVRRGELALDRQLGATRVGALGFIEDVSDQLVNVADGRAGGSLRIVGGGALQVRGAGVTLARRFGDCVTASVTYAYGRALRPAGTPTAEALPFDQGRFHDVVGRIETFFDWTDTRVVAYYRLNALSPQVETDPASLGSRFDVQVVQGLPWIGAMTRADWELMVAFRNLFYETSEGGFLDEFAVVNPPRRVVGGIAVRF